MTTESANDAFERRYMARFQDGVAAYGVVVKYERDRAARDIGVHFFRPTRSGQEVATGSLVWFQMKGFRTKTLPKEKFESAKHIPVTLKVKDLQLWYRMNGPTYLAVYIESIGLFLVLNIVKYVRENFGVELLKLQQKTVDVPVSTSSLLDEQALSLILRDGTTEEWARVLNAEPSDARLAARDYTLIWRLSTAEERHVEHKIDVTDWQSKCRGELAFLERAIGGSEDDWQSVREHIEFMLSIEDVESSYPYLAFEPFDQARHDMIECCDNEDGEPEFTFSDGTVIYGTDGAGELHAYELRPRLNGTGERLATMVATLIRAGMVDPPPLGEGETLDVAPWHGRDV